MAIKYYCKTCNSTIESIKVRKRCSKCYRDLELVENKPIEINEEIDTSIFRPMNKPVAKGKYCRNVPIQIKTKFIDDGEFKEDSKIDKIGKFTVSQRREPVSKVPIQCSLCNRVEEVFPSLVTPNYQCTQCIKKRVVT